MSNHLSRFLHLFTPRIVKSSKLRKRDRLRKYLFESLEPRNLLATFTVTDLSDIVNPSDDATVFTLQEALNAANGSVADDTIQFAPALTAGVVPATIQMTGATFQLNAVATAGVTTINGPGADLLSISGNGTNNGRIFFVNANANVVIRGLTIKNGKALDAVNALSGGAISNDGTLTIEDSVFDNNVAGVDGGAISNRNSGTLQIFGTTFRSNTAAQDGGAIVTMDSASTTIVNSTFSANSARRHGGAISTVSSAIVTLIHTTIVANTARSAGGASGDGGGISPNGFVVLRNSIVAGNKRGTGSSLTDSDIVSSLNSGSTILIGSGNLIGNAATATGLVHGTNGNILGNNGSGVLPLSSILDTTLRANGGRTLTHALLPTSAAIDKGFFNYVGTGANVDQRGQLRPRDYPGIINAGDGRDIGAFELRPFVIDLASLGIEGTTINGQAANDRSGRSVSNAGDVNGDGFDDLIIGADFADPASRNYAGKSYVIFGGSSLPTTINLSDNLGTSVGFSILGLTAFDRSGYSVSNAGDVNGDGFDDLVIGARYADASGNTKSNAGDSYVIFGAASLPATIDLANLNLAGITIFGADAYDWSGISVSNAGDVNGDGFDDLLIGALLADASGNAKSNAGESYVIFGGNGFTNSIAAGNLGTNTANTINGTSGAQILNGANGNDMLIGNGGADILLGGRGNDILAVSDLNFKRIVGGNGSDTLRLDGTGLSLNLSNIRDNRILGIETTDITGSGNNTLTLNYREVLNISDESNILAVIGNVGDRVVMETGWIRALDDGGFKVFTKRAATLRVSTAVTIEIAPVIDLSNLGIDGTTIFGANVLDFSGRSVSSAGDVNGDGFDDLVIGAFFADASGNAKSYAGDSYVIFGKADWSSTSTIDLSNLGSAGITIFGADAFDQSGRSVSSAGDVNGDGFDDLIIGADKADASGNAKSGAGESYVIFGAASLPATID